jgi:hypothetical protein
MVVSFSMVENPYLYAVKSVAEFDFPEGLLRHTAEEAENENAQVQVVACTRGNGVSGIATSKAVYLLIESNGAKICIPAAPGAKERRAQ